MISIGDAAAVPGEEHGLVGRQLPGRFEPAPELLDRPVTMLGGDHLDGVPADQLARPRSPSAARRPRSPR